MLGTTKHETATSMGLPGFPDSPFVVRLRVGVERRNFGGAESAVVDAEFVNRAVQVRVPGKLRAADPVVDRRAQAGGTQRHGSIGCHRR